VNNPLIVTSARALMTRTIPKRDFLANSRNLKVGQPLRLEKMLETWVGAGYLAGSIVVEPGQFARRGGIVDIFPIAEEAPVRIELFGDEIETIRRFDPASQRSGESIEQVTVTPAREALPKYRQEEEGRSEDETALPSTSFLLPYLEFQLPLIFPPASLLEYLPSNALVVVEDWQELADAIGEFEEQALQLRSEQIEAGVIPEDFPVPYHPWADLQDELTERAPIFLAAREGEDIPHIDLGSHFHPGPRYGGQLKPFLDHLRDLRSSLDRTLV